MREILFRGRQKGGTEWFYGDLSYLVHDKQKCYIFPADGYNSPDWYEVDSDTVGQYTGLYDINKKPIYENDILKKDFGSDQIGVQYAFVYYSVEYSGFMTKPVNDWMFTKSSDCEVVGNIYDNPELLEAAP